MSDLEEIVVSRCSVCKSIKLIDTWYSKEIMKYVNILNPCKYSDGICTPYCAQTGYGLSAKDAEEIFK